jgi:hypothetical protein
VTEIHRYAPSGIERPAATTNVVWSSIMAVLYDALLWLGGIAGTGLNGALPRRRLQPPHPRPDPILRFHR